MRCALLLLLASALATAQEDDGPFVLWKGRSAQVIRIAGGQAETVAAKAPVKVALPGLLPRPLVLDGSLPVPGPVRLPEPERILAVSDPHGNLEGLLGLLRNHGVISPEGAWTFRKGHVVVLGDVLDRGPRHTEILWLLRSLEGQAKAAGGRLHVLLGNHEAMVLSGDLRYLHPRYQTLRWRGYPMEYPALFGPDTELGRWIRTRPAVLKLGPWLFVHGGFSPALLEQKPTLEAIDKGTRADMAAGGKTFLLGGEGPLWYRGLVPGAGEKRDAPASHVAALLAHFGARAVVVGHTPGDRIRVCHEGRVIAIDAGLLEGRPGEVLLLERGRLSRGLPDGRREPIAEALKPAA